MALTLRRCGACGRVAFEGGAACGRCGGPLAAREVSGRGSVYSLTRVHAGPEGMPVPYLLALIDLEGGGRVLGRLEAPAGREPAVGDAVWYSGLSDEGPRFGYESRAE